MTYRAPAPQYSAKQVLECSLGFGNRNSGPTAEEWNLSQQACGRAWLFGPLAAAPAELQPPRATEPALIPPGCFPGGIGVREKRFTSMYPPDGPYVAVSILPSSVPSLISLMVSVDVKRHVYSLTVRCHSLQMAVQVSCGIQP